MFIRILGGFVALVVLLWMVTYFSAGAALRDVQREPWPYGLGTIEALKARQPRNVASKEAKEITALVAALEDAGESAGEYVDAQTAKHDDAIDPPPENTGLANHEAPLAELVRAALSGGDRIAWGPDGVPYFFDDAAEILGAAALDQARRGNGPRAWEHVQAMWMLVRSAKREWSTFDARPALRIERAANAIARKLPPPIPPWAAELAAIEPRLDTAAMIQQQTEMRLQGDAELPGPLIVLRPLANLIEASNARNWLAAARSLTSVPRCRINIAQDDPSRADDLYRAARLEAELEATAKILGLKSERARLGRWPAALADATSRCSESHWNYSVEPDGSHMALRLSWELAPEPNVKNAPALTFAY